MGGQGSGLGLDPDRLEFAMCAGGDCDAKVPYISVLAIKGEHCDAVHKMQVAGWGSPAPALAQ